MVAAAASPQLRHPKPGGRIPLQPKTNDISYYPPKSNPPPKLVNNQLPILSFITPIIDESNKENYCECECECDPIIDHSKTQLMESLDASLADELKAVKHKLERLKFERDKTDKLLQERDRLLEIQITQLHHRGQFQKDLEIEVDRLYRLKHLHLACRRMSPIRSLREKEMDKLNKESRLTQNQNACESEKSGESKEEIVDENSSTESPTLSLSSISSSKSAASVACKSTATSKLLLQNWLRL